MTRGPHRCVGAGAAGAAVIGVDLAIRLVAGEPYPGSTGLVILACGVSMLPFLPRQLSRTSLRLAILPALGLVSFGVLLTTVSIVGIPLTELTIRLAVIAFVGVLAALARIAASHEVVAPAPPLRAAEGVALAVMVGVLLFGLASAWDVVGPYPPAGVDWGHYLLYADEVEAQRGLLIDDPYAGEEGRLFADSPGIGAVYGGVRIMDGISSTSLSYGIIILSALSTLSVYAATGALWGPRAGVLAAGAWAVAPIHIDPIRWHGVGTSFALIFVPLVLLALGLLYRGSRGWRVVVLLGTSLLGVAVTHSTSAFVVAFLVGTALVIDAIQQAVSQRSVSARAIRGWWQDGIVRPLLAGVAFACLGGAAVVVHLRSQAADLGSPVDYRLFEPDWLSWRVVVDYYSLAFLSVTGASLALVLSKRELRRDAALLALVALGAACVVVAELWQIEVPFEYRRAVFYLGVGMVMLIGVASTRLGRRAWWIVCYAVVLAYVAHDSVGLRLPERVLSGPHEPKGSAAESIIAFREKLDDGQLPDAALFVADRCHNFVVPYLLRRPTIVAFEPWQVGFQSRVPLAEQAATILGGDSAGRRLARSLGVGYVVANPSCTPRLPQRLEGNVVVSTDELVIVDVRGGEQ